MFFLCAPLPHPHLKFCTWGECHTHLTNLFLATFVQSMKLSACLLEWYLPMASTHDGLRIVELLAWYLNAPKANAQKKPVGQMHSLSDLFCATSAILHLTWKSQRLNRYKQRGRRLYVLKKCQRICRYILKTPWIPLFYSHFGIWIALIFEYEKIPTRHIF